MRREIENAKETTRTARRDWEAGKSQCHVDAPKSRKRLVGSGPPPAFAPIEEALAQNYVHVTKDLKSACPRSILRVKTGQLVTAAKQQGTEEVAHAFEDNSSISMNRLDKFLSRRMVRKSLTTKVADKKHELVYGEIVSRVRIFFRNLTKVRAAYEPRALECDVYDHSPFFRRMQHERALAEKKELRRRSKTSGIRVPDLLSLRLGQQTEQRSRRP